MAEIGRQARQLKRRAIRPNGRAFEDKIMIIDHRGWIKPMLRGAITHGRELWRNPEYRTLQRLQGKIGSYPRRREFAVRLWNSTWTGPDAASFLSAFDDIVVQENYCFLSERAAPAILDCGANVGVGVAWFARRYPRAAITAFEADPRIFQHLADNLRPMSVLGAVCLRQAAAFTHDRGVSFTPDGADGGTVGTQTGGLRVPSVRLADLLQTPWDVLKMDIEGAEIDVLQDCGKALANVQNLFFEYHPGRAAGPLGPVLALLEDLGFRYTIKPQYGLTSPLVGLARHDPLPNLNVYCRRPAPCERAATAHESGV